MLKGQSKLKSENEPAKHTIMSAKIAQLTCIIIGLLTMAVLSACAAYRRIETTGGERYLQDNYSERIMVDAFGYVNGEEIRRWALRNASGSSVTVMNLGATILTIEIQDRDGKLGDVVLGYSAATPYFSDSPYFGAVVGRYANRIANGKFELDGRTYKLAINNPPNSLHGGKVGFDKRLWVGEIVETQEGEGVRFSLQSSAGEEGYPGTVRVEVTYVWTDDNSLIIDYHAVSDAPTPFNISQHTYWNLRGEGESTILGHELRINADKYTPVDANLIPTGELSPINETPFDFRVAKLIGKDIASEDEQLQYGQGYDHNWVLNGQGIREVAWLHDPESGRTLTITTDQPGLQFYSGNFLDGSLVGKSGKSYHYRSGLALETQHYPDSPNHPNFPDTILRPGADFFSRTIYSFGVTEY